jgi:predicted  nucleic acid-binding Zn-ribbon protein
LVYGHYYGKLKKLKNKIIDLKIDLNMAEKDIWERFEKISDEITAIKVQIAKLEVKMYFGIVIFSGVGAFISNVALMYMKTK